MDKLRWYYYRLRSMSFSEIVWRLKSKAVDILDIFRIYLNLYPSQKTIFFGEVNQDDFGFSVLDESFKKENFSDQWGVELVKIADKVVKHQINFFDLQNCDLGDPIKWQKDFSSNIESSLNLIQFINYRDFPNVGDCKLVWEPSRHHQLVILGRAYVLTGELKYAQAVLDQMESWIDQNPYGRGMNWRSPLELAVRVINWVWALGLIHESGLFVGAIKDKILHSAYLHCWDVTRKYSKGSSANNHLVGEAAGVFVAVSYFKFFNNADNWREEAKVILSEQIELQVYSDGCIAEQALGYQFFVLQFYMYCGLVARKLGDDFTPEYWVTIENMLNFVADIYEGGSELPMFGDKDDGYVLDLGNEPSDVSSLLSLSSVMFNNTRFKSLANSASETLYWIYGSDGLNQYEIIESDKPHQLKSKQFEDSGYYLLQTGGNESQVAVSMLFDCGELGYGDIAAHGHADALSFSLRIAGESVLVDSGTYDYFSYPEWRQYFRSTSAHNTIAIDNLDQSEMCGPFLWRDKAEARCLEWSTSEESDVIYASHTGYERLTDSVSHSRRITFDKQAVKFSLVDEIRCKDKHEVEMFFHFAPEVDVELENAHSLWIKLKGENNLRFVFDENLKLALHRAKPGSHIGWISRGYHQKQASVTLVAKASISGDTQFSTKIEIK